MQLAIHGISVTIPDAELERLVLERLQGSVPAVAASVSSSLELTVGPPRIGEYWPAQGGVYAGIGRGRDGAPDYHSIVGPEHDDGLPHAKAGKWAEGLRLHGFSDYRLGSLNDLAIARANCRELFEDEAYWSCEKHAGASDCAWSQSFDYGSQNTWTTGIKLRARAFRRLPI